MVNLTHPDAVNAALLDLLDQVAPVMLPPEAALGERRSAQAEPSGARPR